jgi:hypothetical protein
MADEFGQSQAEVLIRDLALLTHADRTASQLLASGEDPRVIWEAICEAQAVPAERRAGLDKKAKKQHAE